MKLIKAKGMGWFLKQGIMTLALTSLELEEISVFVEFNKKIISKEVAEELKMDRKNQL